MRTLIVSRFCGPLLLAAMACTVHSGMANGAPAAEKPNIIIFLADDLGYAGIGANGCKDIPTPHIDSLARNGVRFTDGYATHCVCSPSRAGLMSGRYQHRYGFEHNSGPERFAAENFGLPRSEPTLAERLKAVGYSTGMVGKWHIGFKEGLRPHERGFDYHYGFLSGARTYLPGKADSDPLIRNGQPVADEKEYLTDAFAREAVAFIDRSKDNPFFLYLAFNAVHSPLEATEQHTARFPALGGTRKIHAGMVAAMDDAVGRVLAKVRALRQEENTLIFFYSDNGGPTPQTTASNEPLRGYKGQFYEGGIREPFLAQWKGRLPAGMVYREMVMGFDCHATALAAAGVPPPTDKPLDGVNLLPFLTGKQAGRPHDQLFWRAGEKHAARVGDWKLVQVRGGETQLFNLKDDISEQNDLAQANPAKLKELQMAFAQWEKGTLPAKWVRQDSRNAQSGGKLRPDGAPSSRRRGAAGNRLEEAFKAADKNGDGKLTRDEYPQPDVFQNVDDDGDGFATMEEVRNFYSGRRKGPPEAEQPDPPPATPRNSSELRVLDAVFELCVRDVEVCAKFYRDGIGMREVEPANADNGALLEWAGSYLQLRKVPGEKPVQATGNPMKQMLSANGFCWFSLWFNDPAAVSDRLVKAGYPAPMKGGNVSMTRDPDGNVVEIMGIPRSVSAETFTWGMAVSDETAARKFYGQTLGLTEFDPWNLPPPFSMKMYLFATGAGRVKFSAPQGQRPRDADAGPDAPGLRSVTLRVADLAAAQEGLTKRGAKVEGEKRLLVTDPDGNRIYIEQAPPEAIKTASSRPKMVASSTPSRQRPLDRVAAQYGNITPKPHKEEVLSQHPGEPPLKKMPDCDATRDAAGHDTLFKSICVPGLTDLQEGMNGVAVVDLNHDGRLDILATYSPLRGSGRQWGEGEKLRVFINDGKFKFHLHPIKILDSKVTPESFGRGQVPVLADFNGDGFLDLFVSRHAQMQGGKSNPSDQRLGNGLYVSEGAWDVFRDVSAKVGIQNEKAYNRQPSFGDVNKDGWLDIAVGCDNIKNAMGGFPHSRLYVFKPHGPKFEDGHFEDIGGADLVPDFGGFYHDSTKDRSGPDINLRDLDNDGNIDLLQSYHVDVLDLAAPYSPIEYRQGVFCWKNLLAKTGKLHFEKVAGNGLACEAHLKLSADKQSTEPVGKAPGLPYISLADVDNDGLPDVLAIGPASPGWAPRTEYVSGRFWRNKGGFQFDEATDAAGLSPLNWLYRDWFKFFDAPLPPGRPGARIAPGDGRPYFAAIIFGDFDNDGWVDLVVQDRSERVGEPARAILFMNRGDGAFEVKPTTFSGLDGHGICGVAADLNNDGLLDLVFAADPDNSGVVFSMDRYESKVYWNTGAHGARGNHWLRLRFSGVKDAELIGARVELTAGGKRQYRWIHPDHFYKSGCALEAHFGLGKQTRANLTVTLPSGKRYEFAGVDVDRFLDLNLPGKAISIVEPSK